MAFTEEIKKQARRKAAYACCVCNIKNISIEVHHIIPEEFDGPDTLENAAALCSTCHSDFGDNPKKRARIKEMRDWWYEVIEEKYKPKDFEAIESLSTKLTDIHNNLPEIKEDLKKFLSLKINEITPQNAEMVVSNISTSAVVDFIPPNSNIWKKVSELENQNSELKGKLELKASLKFKNSAYWADSDGEPFCSRCWEVDEKTIHMHPGSNPAYYSCPECNRVVMAKPELNKPPVNKFFDPRNSSK